jgi:drug/metabolite transporter (DMT)-like permease
MVIAAIFFSLMGVLVKLASVHYSFFELVFYRTVFSVLVLAPFPRRDRVFVGP